MIDAHWSRIRKISDSRLYLPREEPYFEGHNLDLEFYDTHFKPGAYLETHKRHMDMWHAQD